MSLTTLLILADGRLPAGGHAHSGGLEAAAAAGRVHDVSTLERFLVGRLASAGFVAAAFAAAAGLDPSRASELDDGLDARTSSPALRRASRAQGRSLLRAGRALWTVHCGLSAPHQAVALGVVAGAAGLDPVQAATVAAYSSVSGPSSAAVRILGLDPYPAHALLARLAPAIDETATRATALAGEPVDALPALSSPLLDISAEQHASWEVRLFAS
jgi:urease accessory protein